MISILFRNLLVKKEWLSICCYNRIYRFCYGPTFIVWIFVTPTLENIFQVSLEWKTRENISFLAFLEFLPYSAVLYFCLLNFCVRLLLMQRLTSSEYSTRVITDDSQSHFSSIFFLFLSLSKITSCHLVKNRRVSVSSFILLISGLFAWLLEVSVVCSFAFCHKGKTDMYFCCFYFSAGGTKEWVTRKTREKKEEKKRRKLIPSQKKKNSWETRLFR